jgi:hypothetical protein
MADQKSSPEGARKPDPEKTAPDQPPAEKTPPAGREAQELAPYRQSVAVAERGLVIRDLDTLWRLSQFIARSGLAPKGLQHAEAILVAIQMGLELGLSPMVSMQNIAVINGRPSVYGDVALALVRSSGLLERIDEGWEGEGQTRKAFCETKRRGMPNSVRREFSVKDAMLAGLWGKEGPWKQYPDRMLLFRARGFGLRDNFGDVLKGFYLAEELEGAAPAEDFGLTGEERTGERIRRVLETTEA